MLPSSFSLRVAFSGVAVVLAGACRPTTRLREPFPAVRLDGHPIYEVRNGRWFDGQRIDTTTRYIVYGVITRRRPEPVDSVIDLHGAFVIPALREAHNPSELRIGSLTDGSAASFLVLAGDPTLDFVNTARVTLRVKNGVIVNGRDPQ